MTTIKSYMTENKEQVIAVIEDAIRYTNVSLKSISQVLLNCDEQFQAALLTAKDEKYFSKEYNAFVEVLGQVSTIMVSESIDNSTEETIERIRWAGKKSLTK